MAKDPMIDPENRPTAIDYDMPVAQFKLRDLLAVVHSNLIEWYKEQKPESLKPEHLKPERFKEYLKPEQMKEIFKPEKEALKPEKEGMKPEEKPWETEFIDKVAVRIIERLQEKGVIK